MSLVQFWDRYPFPPDSFQREAAEAIESGMSVVVTAPTGAGKTLVAEAATFLARAAGRRVFYTTPIKALSNQKFADLTKTHAPGEVGLLTGDNVINPDAAIIVATLEVLRNMIYADPERLDDVEIVVLDEAHYLQDRSRGAAWEEVIIHCPPHIRFVCLSATISNNAQFADWVEERRGPTRLVTTEQRPVPLESMYMVKERSGERRLHLMDTFVQRDGRRRTNPRLEHMLSLEKGRRKRYRTPSRLDVVERLAEEGMLPAIYFIFSRTGCDSAAQRLAESGLRLTTTEERSEIREHIDEATAHLEDEDLGVIGFARWAETLEAGIASHHAGLIPAFKETVEWLFIKGLVKVVFATETLALGLNMPAKTVVLENLSKFNGESHELLRPGDYTQLTGRAGRRGIDVEGFGVVLHSPYVQLRQVTEIASLGAHELKSSFRPTYNMTANLIANYTEDRAEELLKASFASFQREDSRVDANERLAALEHQLEVELDKARCELGDVEEYLAAVEAAPPSHRRDGIAAILGPGTVVDVDGGSRDGRYLVLKRLSSKNGGSRYLVLGTSGRVSTLGHRQIPDTSERAGQIELPRPFRPRDRRFVQESVRALRKLPPRKKNVRKRSSETIDHPVAACPDASRHLGALRKVRRLQARIHQQIGLRRATGPGLLDEFGAIRKMLDGLGYIDGWSLTSRGERLRGIYNESDLLLAEAIDRGILYGLEPPELAAMLSTFVFDPRSDQQSPAQWPTPTLVTRWEQLEATHRDLVGLEADLRLVPTRQPDPGFGHVAYQWCSGTGFDDLEGVPLAAGDFVRVSRQLVDALRQVRDVAREIEDEALDAMRSIDRGIVAAQGSW